MSGDEIVHVDGDYIILKSARIFGDGFNVYKRTAPESIVFQKLNDRYGWFTTLGAAKRHLESVRP